MKQNTFTKFGVTLFASLVLAACGSSGGGDDNNNTSTSTSTSTATQPEKPSTNTQPTSPTTSTQSTTGKALVIEAETAKVTPKPLDTTNLSEIEVDGVKLTISRPGIYSGGWSLLNIGSTDTQMCCGRYESVKIGYQSEVGKNGYVFYNGVPTAANEIPTTGTATYTGDSLYLSQLEIAEEDTYRGNANLVANFADKTLTGKLTNEIAEVNLDAKINQNSFTGSATSNIEKTTAEVEGKFYGKNAQEIGGMATSEDWIAVFAGKK
ncbi:Slam-dependent surface lipoprotein [Conservatibacter flavescens]|nr:Slam-dependent surface lipoprotein [Conservatibacter flavescens]